MIIYSNANEFHKILFVLQKWHKTKCTFVTYAEHSSTVLNIDTVIPVRVEMKKEIKGSKHIENG